RSASTATGPAPEASRQMLSVSASGVSTGAGVPSRGVVNGTDTHKLYRSGERVPAWPSRRGRDSFARNRYGRETVQGWTGEQRGDEPLRQRVRRGGAGFCPTPGVSRIGRAARARFRPPAAGEPASRVLRRAAGRRWAGAVPSTPALRAAGPGPVLARDPGAGAGGAAAAGAGCPDVADPPAGRPARAGPRRPLRAAGVRAGADIGPGEPRQ